ncbi:MAG TPA: adenosine deaminase [Terriglobales bacterium]|nr:adenosine deaminase [Terriglobales bacterium]
MEENRVSGPPAENIGKQPSPFVLALPKAELHLHLEGAIEPETVVELARNHGQELDSVDVRKLYEYTDFTGFLMCFRGITEHLQTPDDYELITYRLMERLRRENVLHAEVFVAVGTCLYWGRRWDEIFEGLERGRIRGERDFGVSVLWIADAVRHFGPEAAQSVVDCSAKFMDRNLVGFGIGGDERRAAPELFREVYASAANYGMRLTCHAGESMGPQSVWGALKALRSERIGHCLTSHQDRELISHLRDTQVPVEVNITSNVRTGCCDGYGAHPVREFFDEKLLMTLNTDDPAMFGTSLTQEYQIAQDLFGFTDEELKQLAMNSFRASFLPEDKKREFLRTFEKVPVGHGD